MNELRPYQQKALDDLKLSIGRDKHRRVVLQAPTGSGKTVIAQHIVQGALAKNRRICFCVPALSLIDQTVEYLWSQGITDIGVIQGNHEHTRRQAPVQVASVQTLLRRDLPDVDVVVIDECHVRFEFYERWMAMPEWQNIPFIGLSATPWARGMGKLWDDLVIATTTKDLIRDRYLAPYRAFAVDHPDLTGVRTVAGDPARHVEVASLERRQQHLEPLALLVPTEEEDRRPIVQSRWRGAYLGRFDTVEQHLVLASQIALHERQRILGHDDLVVDSSAQTAQPWSEHPVHR